MSKIIYACKRKNRFSSDEVLKIKNSCNRLKPDNYADVDSYVYSDEFISYGVYKDSTHILKSGISVMAGHFFEQQEENWEKVGGGVVDGNYAIFRGNERSIEVITDCAATRTVWYYFDEDTFVASTSQRAIISYIGSFCFDERVVPWVLSTGSLGPELSWDKRIKRMQIESRILLDRDRWEISSHSNSVEFECKKNVAEVRESLESAISGSVSSLNKLDFTKWVMPLSGGYDSRGILFYLVKDSAANNIKTITWGVEDAIIRKEKNDAVIAKKLADTVGVQHEYYHTDLSNEPINVVIDRFLKSSEGRVDHIAGYLDGMKIWSDLAKSGVEGVIRGDEGFGWIPVTSDLTVRVSVGIGLCSDYKNLANDMESLGLTGQELPTYLQQRNGESLEVWRDRLYHQYRLPTILSALSDIKYSYVEQINPLLSSNILKLVRNLPDELRTNKHIFKNIVNSISPDVPYANTGSNADVKDVLKMVSVQKYIISQVKEGAQLGLYSSRLSDFVLSEIKQTRGARNNKNGLKLMLSKLAKVAKRVIPVSIKSRLKDTVAAPKLDGNVLAFRLLIIKRMNDLLSEDARS